MTKAGGFKKTKIIATIGPATDSYDKIHGLIEAGANGLRLNFSHGTHVERVEQVKWIRKASKNLSKPVAIIQDLQGPKIRIGDLLGEIIVKKGQELVFAYSKPDIKGGEIPVQYDFSGAVKPGESMFISDGRLKLVIESVKDGRIYAKAKNRSLIQSRKGINLPDTDFNTSVITPKDIKDLAFGSSLDIDFVAISFVQTAEDIENVRKRLRNLGSSAKVIAKLETRSAVDNLEEIVEASDMVMIARGDLAYEIGPEKVPLVQRKTIALCRQHYKQSIVATQMLISMVTETQPTRAEVSDVASAVFLGADCLMLSDETAIGSNSIKSVELMEKIILYNEKHQPVIDIEEFSGVKPPKTAICEAVVHLAREVGAAAIIAETKSGATAYRISSYMSSQPIIAVTGVVKTANWLSLTRGVKSYIQPVSAKRTEKMLGWLNSAGILVRGDIVIHASGNQPGVEGTTDTIKVRIV